MIALIRKYLPEIIGSITCLALGMLSGVSVKASDSLWYASLAKPFFNPPGWIFGPVWTVLYLMMGWVLGMLMRDRTQNKFLILIFILKFIFNLMWSPIFFYFQNISLAFFDICLIWILLAMFIFVGRKQQKIILLMSPYFLWVSFALVLNLSISLMN